MEILAIQPLEYGFEPTIRHVPNPGELNESTPRGIAPREDSLAISAQAIEKIAKLDKVERRKPDEHEHSEEDVTSEGKPLTEEEQKTVEKLKQRDQEVRTHEQAHIAAGGAHVRGGVSYSTQSGPDGNQYAVGGHVNIDTAPVSGDPDATIAKMQSVRAAALAPAEPSGQDRAVASQASATLAQAQAEKSKNGSEKNINTPEESPTVDEKSPATAPSKQSSILRAYTQAHSFSGTHLNIVG